MAPPPLTPPDFRCEIRLGLVMYGGVALATYINGVAQEFFDAVKGRGVYRLVKALTDSDITVDIVSGTSAGGINGVLLGYALANRLRVDWKRLDVDTVAGAAIARAASHAVGAIPDTDAFFRQRYAVGGEKLRENIPPLVLAQLFAHATLVLKNSVAAALGRSAIAARVGAPVKPVTGLLSVALWLVYFLTTLIRRQPRAQVFVHTTLVAASAAALAVGVRWRADLWWTDDGIRREPLLLLVVVPVVILLAEVTYFRWWLEHRPGAGVVAALGLFAALAVVVEGVARGAYAFLGAWGRAVMDATRAAAGRSETLLYVAVPLVLSLLLRPRRGVDRDDGAA